jgi:hypothetical protein
MRGGRSVVWPSAVVVDGVVGQRRRISTMVTTTMTASEMTISSMVDLRRD